MRALLLGLAFANLAFFGWAHWIEQPPVGVPAPSGVAALQLAPVTARPVAAGAHSALRCASLGPLIDGETAVAVGTALRARGLEPRERVNTGEAPDGYWVYIDKLGDPDARARAMKRLARAGIRDAAVLASSGQISVGLFNGEEGANLRAAAVRSAGLDPIVKSRLRPVDEHWFDVELAGDMPLPVVVALMAGLKAEPLPAWGACPTAATATAATPQ
jgi:hypothetical protein